MKTSVMDSVVRAPDEPEAHAVPLFSLSSPLCLLSITLVFLFF